MQKQYRTGVNYILLSLLLSSGLFSCKEEASDKDFLVGSWSSSKRGVHKILSLRANGSFQHEIRIEGQFTKIIKKTEKASGDWETSEGILYFTPQNSEDEINWKTGQTISFEIVELMEDTFTLKSATGKTVTWLRPKGATKKGTGNTNEMTAGLGPMVVNLSKKRPRALDRYICVDMALNLKDNDLQGRAPVIHPKVREAAIFHLSSLSFKDVNKLDKVKAVEGQLRDVLNPYMKGKISRITFNKFVVTAKQEAIEEFLDELAESAEDENEQNGNEVIQTGTF